MLLFGECLKEHWKIPSGMVVAITQGEYAESLKDKDGNYLSIKGGDF